MPERRSPGPLPKPLCSNPPHRGAQVVHLPDTSLPLRACGACLHLVAREGGLGSQNSRQAASQACCGCLPTSSQVSGAHSNLCQPLHCSFGHLSQLHVYTPALLPPCLFPPNLLLTTNSFSTGRCSSIASTRSFTTGRSSTCGGEGGVQPGVSGYALR